MSIKIDYGKRHWLTEQEQLDECISLMEKHPLNPIYERHGGFIFESKHETSFRIAFYDIPYTFGFTTSDTKLIALISAIVKSNTGGFSITYRKAQEEIRLNEQLQRSEEYKEFLKKQGTKKVHFKRHGSGDWLELQGLEYHYDNYIIEEKLFEPNEEISAMKFSKLYRLIHTKKFHALMTEEAGDM